jgi:hypothetical protein
LNALDQAPVNMRERLTGNPTGKIGQARINFGERLFPAEATETGPWRIPKTLAKDVIQNSPTMPERGSLLPYRQAKWRAQRVGSALSFPGQYRTTMRVGQILNDPKRALTDPSVQGYGMQAANWAIREHPEAAAAVGAAVAGSQIYQGYQAYKKIKGLLGGNDDATAEPEKDKQQSEGQPVESFAPEPTPQVNPSQFDSGTMATTARRPARARRLGTVDTTMPTHIGPSNWYGPQAGYDSGRGFSTHWSSLYNSEQPQGAGI